MSSSAVKRLALLRQQEAELDAEIELLEIERRIADKRAKLKVARNQPAASSSSSSSSSSVPARSLPRSVAQLKAASSNRKPLTKASFAKLWEQQSAIKASEIHRDEIKNSKGVVKMRNVQFSTTPFALVDGQFDTIAKKVLQLLANHKDLKHKQVQVVFESDLDSASRTSLVFSEANGDLTLHKMVQHLSELMAGKIASESPGAWLLSNVEIKGAI